MADQTTITRRYGVLGIAAILAAVMLAVGFYNHSFTRSVEVKFTAPSAGLMLAPGNEVRLRGVPVGRVASIDSRVEGAVLTLALDPKQVDLIPANATARITPSTVVSAPHVELLVPADASGKINAGDSITAAAAVPGINDLFQETVAMLQQIPVNDLNVTLSGLATALDGRGSELGAVITDLNAYLTELNAHQPALRHDIDLAAVVATHYGNLARPLMRLLKHAEVTAGTIRVRQDDFQSLLEAGEEVAAVGTPLIARLQQPLTMALRLLNPVTALLAEYSPEFPCTVGALESQALNNVSLGITYPGAQSIMTLLPGQRGYRYPEDLPQFVDDRGPACYSLPDLKTATYPLPYRRFNDNSHANEDGTAGVSLTPIEFFPPPQPPEGDQ